MKTKKPDIFEDDKKEAKKKRSGILATAILSTVFVMVVGGTVIGYNNAGERVLFQNTFVNGINVGGLTEKEANGALKSVYENKLENFSLKLKHKDKVWQFNEKDFIVSSNIHTIAEEVQIRNNKLKTKADGVNYINSAKENGENLSVAFNYIFVGIDSKINAIAKEIKKEPVNSEINFTPNKEKTFNITEDVSGVELDVNALYEKIDEVFNTSNNIELEIPVNEIKAEITKEQNLEKTKLVSTFSTNVSDSTGNRKFNVNKALSAFNGMVVNPGEQVSFNEVTGPQTKENGYKVATIILNGKFVDGVGGGICQASTTLYNALIRAGVKITEVNKHTLPVKYVPLALDAMVSEFISDLKFENTSENPIYIKTFSTSENVGVNIYSAPLENGVKIKARSEVKKVIPHLGDEIRVDVNKEYSDKVLFKGEQFRVLWPREGYEVFSYLDYYNKNGELIKTEQIRHEIYKPQKGLIVEGSVPVPNGMQLIDGDVKKLDANGEVIASDIDAASMAYENAIPANYCP